MPKETTPYDAVIADLVAKRDQLTAMIETLRTMKGAGIASAFPPVATVARKAHDDILIPHDAFFGMTLPAAAEKYLSLVKTTKQHAELCDALLGGGFKTGASNFPEVVRSTLSRHPDFVKVGRGLWGLREWYGNRGTRKPKRIQEESIGGQGSVAEENAKA